MTQTELTQQLTRALGFDLSEEEVNTVAEELEKMQAARREERPDGTQISLEEAIKRAGRGPYSAGKRSESFTVDGMVAAGFEGVREAFTGNFERGLERNAQLCIYHQGERVVDLWGENQEPGMSTAPDSGYNGDTLQSVYSSGKAIESTVFAIAVDRGLCRYDDLVIKYWPEFGQNGKAEMTIADVLRHDAGLHAFDEAFTADHVRDQANPDGNMSRVIAAQAPWTWPSGEYEGTVPRIYHAVSRGYVLSQMLIRIDPAGRTIGQWMAEELCGPLEAGFYCGPNDPVFARGDLAEADMRFRTGPDRAYQFANGTVPGIVRRVLKTPSPMETTTAELENDPLYSISPGENPQGRITGERPSPMGFEVDPGDADSRYLEITSSSSRASARGMGAIMGMLSNGGSLDETRIISAEGIEEAIRNPVRAADRPNGKFGMAETIFVQGGWCVVGRDIYGWGGAGGSVIQFSPVKKTGFGYTCTGFAGGLSGDQDRVGPIVRALHDALNAR